MSFPTTRHRRLRQSTVLRGLVRETAVRAEQLVAPLFIVPGKGVREEISSLPGQFRLSADCAVEEAYSLTKLGVQSFLYFGIPAEKDPRGDVACDDAGVVQQAVRAVKKELPGICAMVDLCFCEYTSHGHCGVLAGEDVDNDQTLVQLGRQAVSLARAGADVIAPSGMMDGMVGSIRTALDKEGFSSAVIMSYAAKYASAFYGPFREAVDSAPSFGDRRTYQMDPGNSDEAMREIEEDIQQGADIIMVKPALPYLDIIRRASDRFPVPIAAYNVSGEFAMIKAAAERGMIDGERVMMETLLSIKRAGADIIITYFARDAAQLL